MDIQQGNVVTAEQLAQVRVGMTREQVRFLMGTPLLVDPFHTKRWDYLYRLKKGDGSEVVQRRLVVRFADDGKVVALEPDDNLKQMAASASTEEKSRVYDLGSLPENYEVKRK